MASEEFQLTLRFLLYGIIVKKMDPPELSVVAGENFDLAFSHPVHSNAHTLGRKACQVMDRHFREDFVFVSDLMDKFEIHVPYAFAFGCFRKRLSHDFIQRNEVFERNACR